MSMRKNVMSRTLVVLVAVVVAMVLCTAMSHAATVKVLTKERVKGGGTYKYTYNSKGQLTKVKRNKNN